MNEHAMNGAAAKPFLATILGLLALLGATQIEKSSIDVNKRGLQPRWMKNKSASNNIVVDREEKPKACNLGEACESCQ